MGRKIVISFNLQKYVEKVRFGAAVVNAQENTKKKASNNTDCIVPDLIDLFGDY